MAKETWYDEYKNKKTESASVQTSKNWYDAYKKETEESDNWATRYQKDIVDRVNSLLSSHNLQIKAHDNRFSGRKENIYANDYVSDAGDWYSSAQRNYDSYNKEASDLLNSIDSSSSLFSDEWVNSVKESINGQIDQQKSMLDAAKADRDFWESFASEENISEYGSAEDAYKATVNAYKDRDAKSKADVPKLETEYAEMIADSDKFSDAQNAFFHIVQQKDWNGSEEEANKYISDYAKYVTKYFGKEKLLDAYSGKFDPFDEFVTMYTEKGAYAKEAKRIQEANSLASVSQSKDFDQYDDYAPKDGSYDRVYEFINGDDSVKNDIYNDFSYYDPETGWESGDVPEEYYSYAQMTDDEIAIYNYYYAKNGEEDAEKYLNSIMPSLNYREAESMYDQMKDNYLLEIAFQVAAGLDQAESGVKGLVNSVMGKEDYVPSSATQIAGSMALEDLGNLDFKYYNFKEGEWKDKNIFGRSLGQVLGDAVSTGANMLPSILTSTAIGFLNPAAGAVAGSALLGSSAAGNAYQEMINLGYNKNQAGAYAALIGGSESILQYALGGISALGGGSNGIFQSVVGKILPAVDKAVARAAIQIGGNMLDEGLEEGLQEILNPWFKNLTLNTDENVNWNDVAYSTLLGALTAFAMEGPTTIAGEVNTYKTGKKLQEGGITAKRLAEVGHTFSADSVSYQLADKVNENTDAYTLGRLFNEIDATITQQNVEEISRELMKTGWDADVANSMANTFAQIVEGAELSDFAIATIEANDPLARVLKSVLIDSNTTWNQRSFGYNAAVKALADSVANPKSKQAKATQENFPTEGTTTTETKTAAQVNTEPSAQSKKVTKIADIGKKTVTTEDGKTVSVKDAAVSADDQMRIDTIASIENITTDDANYILNTLRTRDGVSSKVDSLAAKEVYKYGYYGFSRDHIAKYSSFARYLTNSQADAIYKLGQQARQAKANKMPTKVVGAKGGIYFDKGGGEIVALKDVDKAAISGKKRSAGVQAAMVLHKLGIGGDIYFFESYLNDKGERVYKNSKGKEVAAPNGFFQGKDNSIHIDLNAGAKGEGLVLFTLAHELTHFVEKWSPKKYKILADFLIENYEKGRSMDELVRVKQENLSAARGKNVSYSEAYSEVIADSMESMLADGNVIEKIRELKAKDSDLVAKIKQFFDNLLAKIRSVYQGLTPDSAEGQAVLQMKDSIEKIQQLFAEALVEASENFRSAEVQKNTTEDGGVKYEIREIGNTGKFYVQADRQVLTGDDASLWGKQIENYINEQIRKEQDIAIPTSDGHVLLLTSRSAYKLKDNHVASIQKKVEAVLSDDAYALKGRAATHIDELIQVARFNGYEADLDNKHENDIGEDGFNYFDSYFRDFDGSYYLVPFSAALNEQEETAYSIGKIRKRSFPAGTGSSSKREALKKGRKASGDIIYTSAEKSQELKTAVQLAYEKALQKKSDVGKTESAEAVGVEVDAGTEDVAPAILKSERAEADANYMDAVNRGDTETAQKMVDEAAKNAGYTPEHLYHGTSGFGFTKIDTSLSDDGISFFVADNINVAQGYFPYYEDEDGEYHEIVRAIGKTSDRAKAGINEKLDITEVVAKVKEAMPEKYGNAKPATEEDVMSYLDRTWIPIAVDAATDLKNYSIPKNVEALVDSVIEANSKGTYEAWKAVADRYQEFAEIYDIYYNGQYFAQASMAWGKVQSGIQMANKALKPDAVYNNGEIIGKSVLVDQYNDHLAGEGNGAYDLYANHDNQLVIRGRGSNWNDLPLGEATKDFNDWWVNEEGHEPSVSGQWYRADTRSIAKYAKARGYRSVRFEDIYDAGAYGDRGEMSTVYAFFNPEEDIKSADTVTYDDADNVIPLSQRFNEANDDIRYSDRDSDGNQLSAEQQEFFKDSKVRDKKGNLLIVYHGTTANFNIFKKGDVGFHFGTKGAARGRVGYGKNVNIKAVYLNITNPIVFDEDLGSWDADYRLTRELYDRGILTMDEAMSVLRTDDGRYKRPTESANKKLATVLIEKGYDGIAYQNTFETKKATTSYIAFSSNQAKETKNTTPTSSPDTRYQDRADESVSNRSLLANAFESVAKNDIEKKRIQEYKDNIENLNAEERKLQDLNKQIKELSFAKGKRDNQQIKDLQEEARKTANRIDTYDKRLLRLEASEPLQRVLERERTKAYKKAEQKGMEVRKAERERAEKAYQKSLEKIRESKQKALEKAKENREKSEAKLKEQFKESRERASENRTKTAMRHKIQGVVGELNQLLKADDKKRHIPDSLKKAVAEALMIVNMDNLAVDNRVAEINKTLAELYDKKSKAEQSGDQVLANEIQFDIDGQLSRIDRYTKMSDKLQKLQSAYEDIKNSNDPDIAMGYDPVIAGSLKELAESIGDTPLAKMSVDQLQDVYDMYKMVLTRVRDANKSLVDAQREAIKTRATKVVGEVKRVGGEHKLRVAALDFVKRFGWDNLKPVYAFEHIGSDTLTEAFNDVRKGEDTWAKDVTDARKFYLDKAGKYNYDSWDFDKKHSFESASGIKFDLTLEQILSLYAYSKRDQALEHLRLGGFVFDSNIETYKEKGSKLIKYKVNTADAHQITPEILADITGLLTKEQIAFVDEMQDYLSTTMGAKGNEVTMKMYGVKLFKEKFYFPLKSAKQFMFEQNEVAGEVRIKNSGFTNKTKPNANNPVILNNFMDVWTGHVNDMSMYHAFTLPLEDFNRIFNYESGKQEGIHPVSVKGTIQNAYGPAAVSYVRQLITDLNGGVVADPRESTAKALIAKFKKAKVFTSFSVFVQQPSAIGRAFALVDPKYFRPTKDGMSHKELWNEVKQYAPVAIIKEMGYFDTNMGRSATEYIQGKEYSGFTEKLKAFAKDGSYRDEVMSRLPALADELTWCAIWNAVKRETVHNHQNLNPGSKEFLEVVGERFTEVITKTQVYDSVLARSANMRSKTGLMNMATSFMAEPTTTINMLQDAIVQKARGKKKYAKRVFRSVLTSIVLNNVLVSFVYAGRDDDEDETYIEKYLQSFASDMLNDVNPITYYPFLKDMWSVLQGYDVERADMSLVADLADSMKAIVKAYSTDGGDVGGAWLDATGAAANLTGIPMQNIRREIDAAINFYKTLSKDFGGRATTGKSLGNAIKDSVRDTIPVVGWLPGKNKADKLYDAMISGDDTYADRLIGSYKDEDAAEKAIRSAIKKSYESGDIDEDTAMEHLEEFGGMEKEDAYWKVKGFEQELDGEEDYNKYDDFLSAVESGKNLKKVVKEYTDHGVSEKTLASQITKYYKPLYKDMSNSERAAINGYLLNAYSLLGYNRAEKSKDINDWLKD